MKRKMLRRLALLIAVFFLPTSFALGQSFEPTEADLEFLDLVQRKAFDYFWSEHNPRTGLVKDKAGNFEKDQNTTASIAATGFGLAAAVVGAERGWISKREAQDYCTKTLRFFWEGMEAPHGFFYHFVHWETGRPTNYTELSSIDTALFLAGALTAGEYFKGTEVEQLANQIYRRVDFAWMMNGGKTLSMGWHPRTGFLKARWQDYNESFILYLLAFTSPTHPIPPESWRHVKKRIGVYGPHVLIYSPPLFTHQYSHIWVDFRDQNDGVADYFENSRIATIVNRQFALDHRERFKTYSENIWGLTASLSPHSYKAYGSEPGGAIHDGTVAPTAAAGSMVFTPELSLSALKAMYENHKDRLWGRYGFSDAFNLDLNWYAREVLGIDQGPIVLMIENYRSELLWRLFMRHPAAGRGMQLAGFRPGTLKLLVPPRPSVTVERLGTKIEVDGDLEDWDRTHPLTLNPAQHHELGDISDSNDASARLFLRWDEEFLYLAAEVRDDSVVAQKQGDKIWQDDVLEIFIDPQKDGLAWGSAQDIQLGLSPGTLPGEGRSWAWFQGFDPSQKGLVTSQMKPTPVGYQLEAKISWKFLRLLPHPGLAFDFSPALHDLDEDGSEGKLNWYFLAEGKHKRSLLGNALLQ